MKTTLGHALMRLLAVLLFGAGMLALGACHDRNPPVQQPYGPSTPSTSPTSTRPHQWPSPTQSVRSPSKPAPAGSS
ncbi:MAG TPA: hypothetical protein VMA74_00600 [Dyella sp.]|uniref:hypothetical protein n=1 Tax=Dyella sp. TaxID=1869338 RepID=UPI002B99DE2B|nr:hypothetical protein [Dyella sp.]HUB88204.1 hypothetical protein [Dyella sp.]